MRAPSFKRPRAPHMLDTSHRNRRQHIVHLRDGGARTWRAEVYRSRALLRRWCANG